MTLVEAAKKRKITAEMSAVAKDEGVSAEFVRSGVADGTIVIPRNNQRKMSAGKWQLRGVGRGLRVKVNANIGSSPDSTGVLKEKKKLNAALKAKADAVMDLSTGGDLRKIRKMVLDNSTVPVGNVPIYETVCDLFRRGKSLKDMDPDKLLRTIEDNARQGVDFITVHCGVTREVVRTLKQSKRITGIVSRGGAFLAEWIISNNRENPLYENFSDLLDICHKYDVTLSLGDGLRPGCLADATDASQIAELSVLGKLTKMARDRAVQVMVEGPGHVPINQIEANVLLQKRLCHDAPFYVLGPLVTDIAAGYDHITCAIGGAVAGAAGADFLCYVTPSEHLGLPEADDVYSGVIATRIAAHAADIARGVKGALETDTELSKARKKFDWKKQEKLALDPERFRIQRKKSKSQSEACTMCGRYCSMKKYE